MRELTPERAAKRTFRDACIATHGFGHRDQTWRMLEVVAEQGLPSRTERERLRAERLAEPLPEDEDEGRIIGRSCKVKVG